ncbi:MAG: SIR2 family NAD-dependent protein deacylase [Promethearchaeota archaeon]
MSNDNNNNNIPNKLKEQIKEAAKLIESATNIVGFTGAGISAESGVPPFRGKGGIWERYDMNLLDIGRFRREPEESWKFIKEVFFNEMNDAKPNKAHIFLKKLEDANKLKAIITQNIDNLHQKAGSTNVIEFHGNTRFLVCMKCDKKFRVVRTNDEEMGSDASEGIEYRPELLKEEVPKCPICGNLLKPDFVFFGEPIPGDAYEASLKYMNETDLIIMVGTTGVIMPAALMPILGKRSGAKIIEINITPSQYTDEITDIFLEGKATVIADLLMKELGL